MSYRDLLYGILLPSGADACRAVAYTVFGSEESMVEAMNEKAFALQMYDTHFANTTGLHEQTHYSTVYDISLLLQSALKNKTFYEMFTATEYLCENGMLLSSTWYSNGMANGLDMSAIQGGKTGFTYEAGQCLASLLKGETETYIMVSGNASDDSSYPYHVEDAIQMYEYLSHAYQRLPIIKKGEVLAVLPVKWGTQKEYEVVAKETITKLVNVKTYADIEARLDGYDVLEAPMHIGSYVGTYRVYENGTLLYEDVQLLEEMLVKDATSYYRANIGQLFVDYRFSIMLFIVTICSFYMYKKKMK